MGGRLCVLPLLPRWHTGCLRLLCSEVTSGVGSSETAAGDSLQEMGRGLAHGGGGEDRMSLSMYTGFTLLFSRVSGIKFARVTLYRKVNLASKLCIAEIISRVQ